MLYALCSMLYALCTHIWIGLMFPSPSGAIYRLNGGGETGAWLVNHRNYFSFWVTTCQPVSVIFAAIPGESHRSMYEVTFGLNANTSTRVYVRINASK